IIAARIRFRERPPMALLAVMAPLIGCWHRDREPSTAGPRAARGGTRSRPDATLRPLPREAPGSGKSRAGHASGRSAFATPPAYSTIVGATPAGRPARRARRAGRAGTGWA